jgi:hypothetical protein
MRGRAIGGLVVAVLLTAACGPAVGSAPGTAPGTGSGSGSTGDGPAPVSGPGSARCPIESLSEGSVPAGFVTAWVLRCSQIERPVAGEGRWWFRVEERAETGIDPLLAALRRPDETMRPGTACPDVGVGASPIALVDAAGRVIHPRLPRDGCDQPQRQVSEALAALRFRETKAVRLYQEQSQRSIDTGCGQMWTDLTADMLIGKPAAARPTWKKVPEAVLVCLWQPRGSGQPRLVTAGTVAGTGLVNLLTRLDHLPAAGSACTVPHHRFAVLQYVRHGWYDSAAYAELDGCRRILRADGTLGELGPATAELITRLA